MQASLSFGAMCDFLDSTQAALSQCASSHRHLGKDGDCFTQRCRLLCRYAVGLLDKRSGVMKYAEVNGGSIVRMEPRAAGTNYGPTGHKTELEETAQARRAHNERC